MFTVGEYKIEHSEEVEELSFASLRILDFAAPSVGKIGRGKSELSPAPVLFENVFLIKTGAGSRVAGNARLEFTPLSGASSKRCEQRRHTTKEVWAPERA